MYLLSSSNFCMRKLKLLLLLSIIFILPYTSRSPYIETADFGIFAVSTIGLLKSI